MVYSKEIKAFVSDLVDLYSKYDDVAGCYTCHISTISNMELDYLVSLIMRENQDLVAEATSYDNDLYERKMLPAFARYLANPNDRDEEIEYLNIWKDGVRKYFSPTIEQLIEDELFTYNWSKDTTTAVNHIMTIFHQNV